MIQLNFLGKYCKNATLLACGGKKVTVFKRIYSLRVCLK